MPPILKELFYQLRWGLPVWLLWLLTGWWPDNRVTMKLRGALHRPFLQHCGRGVQLAGGVVLRDSRHISIGDYVIIGHGAWLNGLGGILLEDEVLVGPYVTISSLAHVRQNGSYRFGGARSRPVRIGRGSWLAAHVSVAAGVIVGEGCLIAANSAVAKDVPPGIMAGGVPAREIGPCTDGIADIASRSGLGLAR